MSAGCRPAHAEREEQSTNATSVPSAAPVATASASASPAPSASAPAKKAELINGCPPEMTKVGKICIDRWEARLVVASDDGSETPHPHNQRPASGVRYIARSEADVFPQAYINRLEARAACQAASKRLCTLGEWYRACRGSKGNTYPYGANASRTKCNTGKPHLLAKIFGNDPRNWAYDNFNDPRLNLDPAGLAKTAANGECTSDYGTFDMVGNVHEWVSDIVDRSLAAKLPLREDIERKLDVNTGKGIFMGGFYSTTSEHGRGCGFVTIGHEPKYHDYSTGFRCCRAAQ